MSHTTTVKKVAIRDINALRTAVATLKAKGVNCDLVENQTPRMYYERQEREIGKCDYVLKLHNSSYDVGFVKDEDGSYHTVFDNWDNQISKEIGARYDHANDQEKGLTKSECEIGKLMKEYSKEASINAFETAGYTIDSVIEEEEQYVITANVGEQGDLY